MDRVIVDLMRSIRQLVQALDNNIVVKDNFGASGAPEDYVIASQGPQKIPIWKALSGIGGGAKGDKGDTGLPGAAGAAGPAGADCGCSCPEGSHLEPQTDGLGDLIYVYDGDGNLDLVMLCTGD